MILPQGALASAPTGNFDSIDPGGIALGWTFDPDASSQSIDVHFYVDGPAGQGTFAGVATANKPRPDVNTVMGVTGDHGFSFQIPATYAGGTHQLYAYAIDSSGNGDNPLIPSSPKSFSFSSSNKQVVGTVEQLASDGTVAPRREQYLQHHGNARIQHTCPAHVF